MEKILITVMRAILCSIGGLILGSIVTSVVIGLAGQSRDGITLSRIQTGFSVGIIASIFVIIFGTLPTLLYGAPMYALTCLFGRASFAFSALIGIAPGVALYFFHEKGDGILYITFGLAVGLSTHAIAKATERKKSTK